MVRTTAVLLGLFCFEEKTSDFGHQGAAQRKESPKGSEKGFLGLWAPDMDFALHDAA